MPTARKYQISLTDTPYYHCVSRCVRRAFLCGEDKFTGKNFDHRKQWIVDKLSQLAKIFAIDVCAFAIMSNHGHYVLRINQEKAKSWEQQEIIARWTELFSGDILIQQFQAGQCKTQGEIDKVKELVEIWRERLMDISWFMRCLNESIARQANAEDKCTGRFWEGRFKSQALLDEQALLAAMVYVDLNPIRAGLCQTLETSEFTSIAQRIQEYFQSKSISFPSQQYSLKPHFKSTKITQTNIPIAKFIGGDQNRQGIPYSLLDYFELADWTGRAIRDDKRGYIPSGEPKIIHKLCIDSETWMETVDNFSNHFYTFIGPNEKLETICQKQNKKWLLGINTCRRLFNQQNQLSP